jgi:hypothetical protein
LEEVSCPLTFVEMFSDPSAPERGGMKRPGPVTLDVFCEQLVSLLEI